MNNGLNMLRGKGNGSSGAIWQGGGQNKETVKKMATKKQDHDVQQAISGSYGKKPTNALPGLDGNPVGQGRHFFPRRTRQGKPGSGLVLVVGSIDKGQNFGHQQVGSRRDLGVQV